MDVRRISITADPKTGASVVTLDEKGQLASAATQLRLAPNDRMTFSEMILVPNDEPCVVDVIVMGKGSFDLIGHRAAKGIAQWRSSAVSIPGR
jgi:hypothetical protein